MAGFGRIPRLADDGKRLDEVRVALGVALGVGDFLLWKSTGESPREGVTCKQVLTDG